MGKTTFHPFSINRIIRCTVLLSLLTIGGINTNLSAQASRSGTMKYRITYTDNDNEQNKAFMWTISDNGKFAVGYSTDIENGIHSQATLWDLTKTNSSDRYPILHQESWEQKSEFFDVTDDGIAVGSIDDTPAYYNNGKWTKLDYPKNGKTYSSGMVELVTPDGSLMIGRIVCNQQPQVCIWEKGKDPYELLFPDPDYLGDKIVTMRAQSLSADGRYVAGQANYNYPQYARAFVWDRQNNKFESLAQSWCEQKTSTGSHLCNSIWDTNMSANGQYIVGICHEVIENDAKNFDFTEADKSYFIERENNNSTPFTPEDQEVAAFCVSNQGIAFGASPINFPVRTTRIRVEGKWMGLEDYLSQNYENSTPDRGCTDGQVQAVTPDGHLLAIAEYIGGGSNYIIELSTPIGSAIEDVVTKTTSYVVGISDGIMTIPDEVATINILSAEGKYIYYRTTQKSINLSSFQGQTLIVELISTDGTLTRCKVIVQ